MHRTYVLTNSISHERMFDRRTHVRFGVSCGGASERRSKSSTRGLQVPVHGEQTAQHYLARATPYAGLRRACVTCAHPAERNGTKYFRQSPKLAVTRRSEMTRNGATIERTFDSNLWITCGQTRTVLNRPQKRPCETRGIPRFREDREDRDEHCARIFYLPPVFIRPPSLYEML